MPHWQPNKSGQLGDEAYQDYILQGVSRTFALTIPQLPPGLRKPVSNAYLLCRIADTIEDEPALSAEQKRHFSRQFIKVVAGEVASETFAAEFYPLLSEHTPEAEKDLIKNMPQVIRITHSFSDNQRTAMLRCIRIMANGMATFQSNPSPNGLKDLPQLDSYCYHVAGVVGEMLTELFCDYSGEIGKNRETMLKLATSFGQGLQMTNILKDIWEDRIRGACWLPQDIFHECGFDLRNLSKDSHDPAFGAGLEKLIAIAHAHLRNALAYTLLIPKHETGIRKFCFWALGMAVLTLRKISANRAFTSGNEVKISRRAVKTTILATHLAVGSNTMPRWLFNLTTLGLPRAAAL
ncbi:MAG TPA: phytoene/squalene synthase family protein [Burkholderiales bacterium]|nr:phytoene/squalene synthase family protein [Burkholderiales bacterium]